MEIQWEEARLDSEMEMVELCCNLAGNAIASEIGKNKDSLQIKNLNLDHEIGYHMTYRVHN